MYNHECMQQHYNLHFMYYIKNIKTVWLQIKLTEQIHYCKLPPTAPSILHGSFSPNRTPLKYSKISRNDEVYRQLHKAVLKTTELATSICHNPLPFQRTQSRRQKQYYLCIEVV